MILVATDFLFILAGCLVFLSFIQFFYWCYFYTPLYKAFTKGTSSPDTSLPPLSVIIVTQEAGECLNENLPKILEQDYPDFEVIVVNVCKHGDDEDILKRLEARYTQLYHTFIPDSARYVSRKKLGISVGIKASKHEWIVVTEPQCYPNSNQWLQTLAREFTNQTEVVVGYCNYEGGKGGFARRVRLDGLFCAIRYLGRALRGYPQMGIGKNLAYRKSAYERNHGFAGQLNLVRGEDDLLVNRIATRTNTRVAVGKDSIVHCPVPTYKRTWFIEKIGQLVTAAYYRGCAGICNGVETCSAFLTHPVAWIGMAYSIYLRQWYFAAAFLLLWTIRTIMVGWILSHTARALGENLHASLWFFDYLRPWWALQLKIKYWFRTKSDYLRK